MVVSVDSFVLVSYLLPGNIPSFRSLFGDDVHRPTYYTVISTNKVEIRAGDTDMDLRITRGEELQIFGDLGTKYRNVKATRAAPHLLPFFLAAISPPQHQAK
jgi:hypothetical protein